MSSLMVFQGATLTEDFPTVFTFEWFLSSVNHLMSAKARASVKNFPTQSTFTWFMSSVNVTLSIEEWPLTKWFSMLFADIMFASEGNYWILKWRCRSNFISQISASSRIPLWVRNLLWGEEIWGCYWFAHVQVDTHCLHIHPRASADNSLLLKCLQCWLQTHVVIPVQAQTFSFLVSWPQISH